MQPILHNRPVEKCPVILETHQIEHVKKIWDIISKQQVFSYIDSSIGGLGKTHIALCLSWWLQKCYNTKLVVFAPNESSIINDDGWEPWAEYYGVKLENALTYSSLRSKNSEYAYVYEDQIELTDKFKELCETGTFFVFDEFHKTTRNSLTHKICFEMIKYAKEHRRKCRVALLSFTPGDKEDHIVQILKMAGLIKSDVLLKHIPFTKNYEWEQYGLGEIIKICEKLVRNNPEELKYIKNVTSRLSAKRAKSICLDLYLRYIKPIVTHAMPIPVSEYKTEMYNAFFEMDDENTKLLENGISLLKGAVSWNNELMQIGDEGEWSLANIGIALKIIERAKLGSIANYILKESKKHPNKKFVVCCGARCTEHIDIMAELLSERQFIPDVYSNIITELVQKDKKWRSLGKDMINYIKKFLHNSPPLVINGKTKVSDRIENMRKFQENTNDAWCIIISPGTGSEAISLHDKFGSHPREMIISPDFYFSRTVQSTCRIARTGMKSDSKVLMAYSKTGSLETSILDSMIRKTKVAKEIMAEGEKARFPGEFPSFIEGEIDVELEKKLSYLRIN